LQTGSRAGRHAGGWVGGCWWPVGDRQVKATRAWAAKRAIGAFGAVRALRHCGTATPSLATHEMQHLPPYPPDDLHAVQQGPGDCVEHICSAHEQHLRTGTVHRAQGTAMAVGRCSETAAAGPPNSGGLAALGCRLWQLVHGGPDGLHQRPAGPLQALHRRDAGSDGAISRTSHWLTLDRSTGTSR
jgi:hypothetical protein